MTTHLSIDPSSAVPLHAQVEQLLRTLIREPAYEMGKLLPPETELAVQLGISRSTLRASINKLVYEGLLTRKRGHGTRVIPTAARSSRMEKWESFTREMTAQGAQVQTFYLDYSLRKASDTAAQCFGAEPGALLYTLERHRGFDDKRVVHFLSCFSPLLKLNGEEDFTRPLYDVLREKCGVTPQHSRERITAVAATEELAQALDVAIGAPLLRRERNVTDQDGRPIEFAVNHYRTDRFEYTIDIKRSGS